MLPAMRFFRFDPLADPGITIQDYNKSVILIRHGTPCALLVFGDLRAVKHFKRRNSKNQPAVELHFQIANSWQELAEGDEVFIYSQSALTPQERTKVMDALGWVLTGVKGPEDGEIAAAVASILDTYQNR